MLRGDFICTAELLLVGYNQLVTDALYVLLKIRFLVVVVTLVIVIVIHVEIGLGDAQGCVVAGNVQALAMHLDGLHGQVAQRLIRALK